MRQYIGYRPKENFAHTMNRLQKRMSSMENRWNRPFRGDTLLNSLGTAPIMFIPASQPIHCITSAIDKMSGAFRLNWRRAKRPFDSPGAEPTGVSRNQGKSVEGPTPAPPRQHN